MSVDDLWLEAAWEDLNGTIEGKPLEDDEWYPELEDEEEYER